MAEPSEDIAPLHVSCHAMDLRYVTQPLMVGHYDNDPIACAEALIDKELVAGELSIRNRLGLYAGRRDTSTVVLMARSSREQQQSSRRGAVVIGLGKLGDLSAVALTEAVRVGTLRYLLQILDRADGSSQQDAAVGLATLLIGQNSANDIHIEDSVAALVQGVMAANEQFDKAFEKASLRVGRLQLVEKYIDTAITATRSLKRLEEKLNRNRKALLSVEPQLLFGKGWRHRLDAAQTTGYWPRLIVTNAENTEASPPAQPISSRRPGVHLASQLSFSFLGERARAETLQQQRQSGLVEKLVEASIQNPTANPDLSRTLFQLLVPTAFKDLARDLDQLVMVLDDTTANLPWELLRADNQPLALTLAMVRQLKAPRFRPRVRQATRASAYVIGNPSSEGFYTVFTGEGINGSTGLSSLDGARKEAEAVIKLLQQRGYPHIQTSLEEENGVDVINKLYQQPYRVLHIAGHGVYEHPTRQGDRRSGVVLSGGILITSAEIEAMEVVPDLVFLNCCHLGTVKREPLAFNRLAASVACQLIEMGVRAVVACGWAVDDRAALVFAETFYTAMLDGKPFGEAVFEARKAAHKALETSNTWGAYQAYGDPAYQLEPTSTDADGSSPAAAEPKRLELVTPIEVIDQLNQLELQVSRTHRQEGAGAPLLSDLATLLDTDSQRSQGNAEIAMAVADVYAALGGPHREDACRYYLDAIHYHGPDDKVPIRALEQLANLEARLGEQSNNEQRVVAAIERLEALIPIASIGSGAKTSTHPAGGPSEWQALLGSAYKSLAALRARSLNATDGPINKADLANVMTPLSASIAAYGLASGSDPDHRINHLALRAVHQLSEPADKQLLQEAKALVKQLRQTPPKEGSFGDGIAMADALLVCALVDRRLGEEGAAGEEAARKVEEAYLEAFATLRNTPLERESAVEHISLLGDLVKVQGKSPSDPCPTCPTSARRLQAIADALREQMAPPTGGEEGSETGSEGGEDVIETL